MRNIAILGLGIWVVGTAALRFFGERLLIPGETLRTLTVYLISFAAMAWLVPRIFRRLKLEKDAWFPAVTVLMFPTLLLDPLSCLFFTSVFPNMHPGAAGVFGGLMLICCGGAVAGVWLRR